MVNNTVFQFVVSNLGVEIFLKRKREHIGYVEIEDWDFSEHFVLGFQENSTYTLHLCFSYYITKSCKVYTKTDSWFQNHIRNLGNFRQAVESPKSWNLMGYFCPKTTFLQLKYYIQRIYLTLLSTTCVKIHQIYVIFETISHFSRHNSSVSF